MLWLASLRRSVLSCERTSHPLGKLTQNVGVQCELCPSAGAPARHARAKSTAEASTDLFAFIGSSCHTWSVCSGARRLQKAVQHERSAPRCVRGGKGHVRVTRVSHRRARADHFSWAFVGGARSLLRCHSDSRSA